MSKLISNVELSETLTLAECSDGFWLYDEARGMNLSMRAKTSTDALVEALMYYQQRLRDEVLAHNTLRQKVRAFVACFSEDDDDPT